jgi:hypothetical protein
MYSAVARSEPPALIWVTTTAVSTTDRQHLGDRKRQHADERHAQAEAQLRHARAKAGDHQCPVDHARVRFTFEGRVCFV